MVQSIEDLDSFHAILETAGDKLVVVDFTATWCGPCKQIAPRFKELSEEGQNGNVLFLKVDVEEAPDVAAECKISAMPTFHFYKNGKLVEKFTGASYEQLVKMVVALRS